MKKYTLEYIRKNGLILLEVISGSNLYGTNIEGKSDVDIRGVFMIERDDLYGMNYVEQINDEKNDIIFYELRRFMELALTNNPNILELISDIPEDCLIYKNPIMDYVRQELLLSKRCRNTFYGYAYEQIKKAKGLNKKIYNPVEINRKSPIDFCYAFSGSESKPLTKFLEDAGYENKFCGVSSVPHSRDVYALFYDMEAHLCFSEAIEESLRKSRIDENKKLNKPMGLGFKGISFEDSNGIRMSSIPKDHPPVAHFYYNKDGYIAHCRDYKEYWDWVEKRNKQRYEVSERAKYDCKNMMHCVRLLNTAIDIANEGRILARRKERDFLMKIRNGEFSYEEVLEYSENLLPLLDEAFNASTLQDEPDRKKVNDLLIKMRTEYYG